MANTRISQLHWHMITDAIHRGKCVPFLGAAANVSSGPYKGLPLGTDVALRLIESLIGTRVKTLDELARVAEIRQELRDAGLEQDLARLVLQNLARVALHVEVHSKYSRPYLHDQLRAILDETRLQPSSLLTTLAKLPLRLLVTTNYDWLLERALDGAVEVEQLTSADLVEPERLLRPLRTSDDVISKQLAAALPEALRQRLARAEADPGDTQLTAEVLTAIDKRMRAGCLFEDDAAGAPHLSEEVRRLTLRCDCKDPWPLNRILLEEAYPGALRPSRWPYRLVVQPRNGWSQPDQRAFRDDPPRDAQLVLYKIHGSLQDPSGRRRVREGITLTEEDYIEFLTTLGTRGEGIPNFVAERIAQSSLLFLGYSLEDWDFRTIYKGLIERLPADQRRASFAIQSKPPTFWVSYWEHKGVTIYDYDIYAFAAELEVEYQKRFGSSRVGS